jgi:electron transport complex protein RnfC
MLITQVKPKDDILSLTLGKTVVIICEGCNEVYFPEKEAAEALREVSAYATVLDVIAADYLCNPEHLESQTHKQIDTIAAAEAILVFSCGVGVQTIAEKFTQVPVFSACDTYPLPGYQGVTPLVHDCSECGECYLNDTGGICPITACTKSLVNGQCGGAKNGKCEADNDMECGWERIYRRLNQRVPQDEQRHNINIRSFLNSDS